MKTLLWILALFALAVGLVVAARYNAGYVLVVFPTRRLELSLTFALVLLVGGFSVAYVLARGVSAAVRLPADVQRFHEDRRTEAGRAAFMESVKAYFEGRYGKAEKAAAHALSTAYAPALSSVIAARAAHETRAFEARDHYLNQIDDGDDQIDYLRRVTHAELLLDERRYLDALAVLGGIGERHTAALRLELKAHQLARNWDRVETLLPLLDKRRVYDPVVLSQIRRTATAELLKRQALDVEQLRASWGRLPNDLARDEMVARAGAEAFIQLGAGDDAGRIIEQALAAHWDSQLVMLYAEGAQSDTAARIENAEGWLPEHPRDASLLLTLGRLCARASLWGKAHSYFEASLAIEASHTAHLELARLARQTGRDEEAAVHQQAALDLALGQLDEVTGGRRRRLL